MAKQRKSNQSSNQTNKRKTTKKRTTRTTTSSKPQQKKKSTSKKITSTNIPSSPFINSRLHIIGIFVLSFLLYGNTLTHDYTQDDAIVITQNEFTKKGISGISDILNYDTFVGFFGKQKDLVAGGRYRPMSVITFAVEWQFFGENPFISHLVNILLYGLTGVVLYLIMLLMFKNVRPPLEAYFIAIATTTLFLAHPIHTEAVANIKGRDEIMALLGSLTTLYWAFRYRSTQNLLYLGGAIFVFFLALMSKENTITFLAIIPVALYFFPERDKPSTIGSVAMRTLPYVAVAVIFLFLRSNVLGEAGSIGGPEAKELMNNAFVGMTPNERYGTIFYTLGKYIQLLIFPHPLTHDYYPRHIPTMTFGDWQALLSLVFYLAIGIYALLRMPKKDPIAFGIIFYIASLSVVSNLFVSVGTNMSERLVFMPSVGFCLIVALLLSKFLLKKDNMRMALVATAIIGVLYLGKTFTRNYAWKDNFTLFTTDIKTSVNSAKLNNAVGGSLIDKAIETTDKAEQQRLYNEAIPYLTKAVEVHPTYENAYNQFGRAYYGLGDYEKAAEYFRHLAQTFNNPNGRKNLYETGKQLSTVAGTQQDPNQKVILYQKAIPILEECLAYFPNDTELLGHLGASYASTNRPQQAIEYFEKVIQIQPNNAKAHLFAGYSYSTLGQQTGDQNLIQKGAEYQQKASAIDPNVR